MSECTFVEYIITFIVNTRYLDHQKKKCNCKNLKAAWTVLLIEIPEDLVTVLIQRVWVGQGWSEILYSKKLPVMSMILVMDHTFE